MRSSLRSLQSSPTSGAFAGFLLLASVGLTIYSDVGLSAQIMTNIEPEVISEIGYVACEPVPTRRLDEASGACGAADAAIWAATSLDVWINDVMTPCGRSCGARIYSTDCAGQCASSTVSGGDFSAPCITCVDDLAKCNAQKCLTACLGTLSGANPNAQCNQCSEISCYGDFYACSALFPKHASFISPPPPPSLPPPPSSAAIGTRTRNFRCCVERHAHWRSLA